jgi:hypothetical protein
MKADAHRQHAESLERAISLAQQDPSTSVAIIEDAWGAAYHWISYGCIQKHQQHRDKHQGLAAYLVSLGEQEMAQWWRDFEALRQAGFYGNQIGESEVKESLELLEHVRNWATT